MNNCKIGNHKFVKIISFGVSMESAVVRWCKECGSVVVDLDYDGKTSPGAIMSLKSPRALNGESK